MLRYFDSHAHLDADAFDEDRDGIIAALPEARVMRVMNIGCDLPSSRASIALAHRYPGVFFAAVGSHPDDAGSVEEALVEQYRLLAQDEAVRAIGEIGLDYHYDDFPPEVQKRAFRLQLELAAELGLPVICHVREAIGDAVALVREFAPRLPGGVFHCFSGSAETALELVKLGFYIGFTGVLTFKNARRAVEAAAALPLERILIETDCPYMAPVPHRGHRNDSRYVPLVAQRLAEIKDLPLETVAEATYQNACRLFGV